jgi:two-component system invasion response regulator UvrY
MKMNMLQSPIALVVEDHDAVRRALCDRIKVAFGQFRLREAGSVDEALKIVDAEKVDIVLMDIHLPGMDGVDGTRAVLEHSPRTSVVVVSMFDDTSHRAAASEAGASAYVCKRAINRELIPILGSLLDGSDENARGRHERLENLTN